MDILIIIIVCTMGAIINANVPEKWKYICRFCSSNGFTSDIKMFIREE